MHKRTARSTVAATRTLSPWVYRTSNAVLLLLLFAQAQAQNSQCTVTLTQLPAAPELLGFRLGMTKEQVKDRVPQVVFGSVNQVGVSKTTINPDFDPRIEKSSFQGVRSISLDFLNDRLTSLWVGYDSSFKVTDVAGFVARISQSLHLPDAWRSWRSRGQQMNCTDFQLTVSMVADGPSFRLLDSAAEEEIAARREAKEEEREAASQESEIVGDNGSKIYYAGGCQPPKEIAPPDRVTFKSSEDAARAGFKAATGCKPGLQR